MEQLSKQLYQLRKSGHYVQALEFYKQQVEPHYTKEQIAQNQYIPAHIMHCLRKTSQEMQAYRYLFSYLQLSISSKTMPMLVSETGWTLVQILNNSKIHSHIIKTPVFNNILVHLVLIINSTDNYLLFSQLVFKYLSFLKNEAQVNWILIEKFCAMFAPENFNNTINQSPENSNIKPKNTITDMEKYFLVYTKALYTNREYDSCIITCNNAIGRTKNFAPANKKWILRTKALAFMQLNDYTQALQILEPLYNKNTNDAFMAAEIATIYFKTNNVNKAAQFIATALLTPGRLSYKTGYLKQAIEILNDVLNAEIIKQHVQLWVLIQISEKRKTDSYLNNLLIQHNINVNQLPPNVTTIFNQLKPVWQSITTQHKIEGIITRILNDEKNGSGFITGHDNKSYYFTFNKIQKNRKNVAINAKVYFTGITVTHKGIEKLNATDIEILGY